MLSKDQRTNFINRRSVAWLLELSLLQGLVIPFFMVLLLRLSPTALASARAGESTGTFVSTTILLMLYLVVRDTVGVGSWGKRVVGLAVAAADGGPRPAPAKMMLRNLLTIVPILPVVEYYMAYKGNEQMQRLGDKMAGTCVVSTQPDQDIGTFNAPLLLSAVGLVFSLTLLAGWSTEFWVWVML